MLKINLRNEIYQTHKQRGASIRKHFSMLLKYSTITEYIRHYLYYDFKALRFRLSVVPTRIYLQENKELTGFKPYYHIDIKRTTQILKPKESE